jgi:hypothetical protein
LEFFNSPESGINSPINGNNSPMDIKDKLKWQVGLKLATFDLYVRIWLFFGFTPRNLYMQKVLQIVDL